VAAWVLVVLFASAAPTEVTFARAGAATEPSLREEMLFDAILKRLEANIPAMPIRVDDALSSLTGQVTKEFDCPPGSPVSSAIVTVTTAHVAWNRRLAVEHSMGTYSWNVEMVATDDRIHIAAHNWVMIDPQPAGVREASLLSESITNEALLYHELLHGQLLISMMDTPEWQAGACRSQLDLAREEQHHAVINPAVAEYMQRRSGSTNVNASIKGLLRVVGVPGH